MLVRRPEYDTSDTYWAAAGPRILSYTWQAHRNSRLPISNGLKRSFHCARLSPKRYAERTRGYAIRWLL
jgi:hypothetical protein